MLLHFPPLDVPEVIFFPTQLYWVSGVFSMIYSCLYGAKRVITSQNMTAELYVEILEKFDVTIAFGSPAIQYPLIKGSKVGQMSKIRIMYLGGVAINEEVVKKLQILCPNGRIKGSYATTEADLIAVSRKPQRGVSSGNVNSNYKIKVIKSSEN
jgi:acyl-coenzyme A synthetase/AMP-(fatty) acid ligase